MRLIKHTTDNPSIRLYANKLENRITFEIKTGYSLELLTPETMKLHRSTKSKITKDENGKNEPPLKITEVILILSIVILPTTVTNMIQESCIHLFLINRLVNW